MLLTFVGCEHPLVFSNRPPTVVIVAGPGPSVVGDSVRFVWEGRDSDGVVVTYRYGLDDPSPDEMTDSISLSLNGIVPGRHVFYVQAVDDSGACSSTASRAFRIEVTGVVRPCGSDTTLELATWNMEFFPLRGDTTVDLVRAVIQDLDIDMFAVQEIADTIAFAALLARLPGYDGLYSRDDYGHSYQKTGVVYRTSVCSVSDVSQLFWGNDSFPRPPLMMAVRAAGEGWTFDFRLVVLHLKAGGSLSDRAKRAAACRILKEYLDEQVGRSGEDDWLVVGDWNDLLDDPPSENVFLPLLDDTLRYRFLTLPLAGNARHGSYIPSGGLIDHIMATAGAMAEYSGGYAATLRLDDQLGGYEELVSDHRPVMVVFPVADP